MKTYLKLLSGFEKGTTYLLRPGLRIGSGPCDFQIKDPLLPPLHSQILLDKKNQLVLVCTNAVFEIRANGKAVKKQVLTNGLQIQIGGSHLMVTTTNKELIGAFDPLAPKDLLGLTEKTIPLKEELLPMTESAPPPPESSKVQLLKELRRLSAELQNPLSPPDFRLFQQPFKLRVEQGPQADDEFILAWGPRDFGPQALEFQIEFPPFPGVLFTLSPTEQGKILFSTKHPDFARVSGHVDSSCDIDIGDRIEAGNSTILVELLKDHGNHD